MKTKLLFSFLLVVQSAFAQGTLRFAPQLTDGGRLTIFSGAPDPAVEFESILTSAVPDMTSGGMASFSLDRTSFTGLGGFGAKSPITFVRVENKTREIVAAGEVLNVVPIEGSEFGHHVIHFGTIGLNDTQINELLRGEWVVNIGTAEYPQGVIGGPILLVPEPQTLAIVVLGLALLRCFRREDEMAKKPVKHSPTSRL